MSHIGKKPILIPDKVKVQVRDTDVLVEGPKGKQAQPIVPRVSVKVSDGKIWVEPRDESRKGNAYQGLMRALINNLVKGVNEGFEKTLNISGVGWRAEVKDNKLVLHLGYSHLVEYAIPGNLEVVVERGTRVRVQGIDRHAVSQAAATIRAAKIPDPYKAKGITYEGERIRRKAGKKGLS